MILLPLPKLLKETNKDETKSFQLELTAMIVLKPSCPHNAVIYAQMLKEEILSSTGFDIAVTKGYNKKGDIILEIDEELCEKKYCLTVEEEKILLRGGSLSSLGWGVQTLRQLFRQYAALLPNVYIEDEPDFENRGFFHDVTRGRIQTLPNLKKMVDTMVFYKLNQLQLYIEHTYLFRDMPELWRDETPLTSDEILELDTYCFERGVELVPCLASFGHLYKLLSTRTYSDLCELRGSAGQEFSFCDRMEHHTLNAADHRSKELACGMIGEFMQLFRSEKFNICADETFDLGKEKSRETAEKMGRSQMYAEFVQGLFDFLIKQGKKPMFWGDIICESPELLKTFSDEVACLCWGYSENQKDTEVKILYEAGTRQYVCPGTRGWNHWTNQIKHSYANITKMCNYGRKYKAVGVLNTDWGDYGHINHPVFSVPGLIYGAVFSWNDAKLDFDEINRQISILEFGDASGALVDCLAKISDAEVFGWTDAVQVKEWSQKDKDAAKILKKFQNSEECFSTAEIRVKELKKELIRISRSMEHGSRSVTACALLSLRMIELWNGVGQYLVNMGKDSQKEQEKNEPCLADELEQCLFYYKKYWRENSKEGDLAKISDVFFWYADLIRSHKGTFAYQ